MELLSVILAVFAIGVWLVVKFENPLGIAICVVTGFYLVIHIMLWSTASYNYNQFVIKRAGFVNTLKLARESNEFGEIFSLQREVSEWNIELESYKYDNTVWMLKDYIDDRFDKLEPIN